MIIYLIKSFFIFTTLIFFAIKCKYININDNKFNFIFISSWFFTGFVSFIPYLRGVSLIVVVSAELLTRAYEVHKTKDYKFLNKIKIPNFRFKSKKVTDDDLLGKRREILRSGYIFDDEDVQILKKIRDNIDEVTNRERQRVIELYDIIRGTNSAKTQFAG